MGKAFNTIAFRADLCNGCGDCMTACIKVNEPELRFGPAQGKEQEGVSRIKILPSLEPGGLPELALCRQCADPKCVMDCPSGALTKSQTTGIIEWNHDICVNCLICTVGCSYAGITYEPALGHVSKCEGCGDNPPCVAACETGALTYRKGGELFNTYAEKEDMFVPGLSACQGCNSELLIRHTLRKVGTETVVAAPPGCIPGMGTVGYNGKTGAKVPIFHPLLTNTASMLAGMKAHYQRQNRDVTMLALAGDGGASDAGFQSLSGAAERNDPILFVCVDNEGYMNTGMQASGATPQGSWTSTTPVGEKMHGKTGDAKNLAVVMMMHNCSYVATASTAFLDDYYVKLEKAMEASKTGMAYLHVYAPCPTGWRFASDMTTEIARLQVESSFVTLWEYERDKGLRFTYPVAKPRPVKDYVSRIGKYKHLTEEEVAVVQEKVWERLRVLKRFALMAEGV